MNIKEQKYFAIADSISQFSDHPRTKLGCVIVKNKQIISSGCNSNTKTSPLQKRLDKKRFPEESSGKIHAEIQALLPLINNHINFTKTTLYVSRKLKDGSLALSRPCPACMALIKACGIKTIHYTTADGYATEILK